MTTPDVPRVPLPPEPPHLAVDALNTGSRVLLSVLPFGSAVVTAWDAFDGHVMARTFATWAAELTKVVRVIEERTGRTWEQLLEDDGFCDAVGRASHVASVSRQEATRRALCNALVSVGTEDEAAVHADEAAGLLGLLADVTPAHMRALGFLEDPLAWCRRAGVSPPEYVSSEADNAPSIAEVLASLLGPACGWAAGRTIAEDLVGWGLCPRTGVSSPGIFSLEPLFGPDREMLTGKARAFLEFVRGDFGDPTSPPSSGP